MTLIKQMNITKLSNPVKESQSKAKKLLLKMKEKEDSLSYITIKIDSKTTRLVTIEKATKLGII